MLELLKKYPLPSKDIKVLNNRSIIVTCFSLEAAQDWAIVLTEFSKVAGVGEGVDSANFKHETVYRVLATI